MRKFLASLLLALALCVPRVADAGIAFVQSARPGSTCTGPVSTCTTAAITTTSGNGIVVVVSFFASTQFSSITDSKSNSWTQAGTEQVSANSQAVRMYYNCNITGGASHTFTLTLTTTDIPDIAVLEMSGQATASCLDKTAQNSESSTSHSSGSTATTAQANELLVGIGGTIDSNAMTSDVGWTEFANQTSNSSTTSGTIAGYKIVSATGAYAYTYTNGGTNNRAANIIGTFKEAAAAASGQKCVGCGISSGKVINE